MSRLGPFVVIAMCLLSCPACGAVTSEAGPTTDAGNTGARDGEVRDGAQGHDARLRDVGDDSVDPVDARADMSASDASDAPGGGHDAAKRDATPDAFSAIDAGGYVDAGCPAEGGSTFVDAGRIASCDVNPCGSGQFCSNFPSVWDGGDSFAGCLDIPQQCICTPTCTCIETWSPVLICGGGPACAYDDGRAIISCRQEPP